MQPKTESTPADHAAAQRPTRVRHVVLLLTVLAYAITYMDRQILAVLSPTILHDVGLNAQSYGEIVSAFSIAYMLANPIWGAVLDGSAGMLSKRLLPCGVQPRLVAAAH